MMEPPPVDDVAQDPMEDQQRLQECYHAFLARRVARGGRSIRTRRGFEQLRANYQPRVRFLLDQCMVETPTCDDSDGSLRELVGPYVDQRVLQFVVDDLWPLAHFGPREEATSRMIPDWQELGAPRYFAVMANVLLWMFPGLPGFEVQELMERDWQSDRDFDPYGDQGLSLEGFAVSMIDLAVACTNGSVDRCLEFLQHLADRLQTSLAPVNNSELNDTLSNTTQDRPASSTPAAKQLRWKTIPMGQLIPCQPRKKPQYYELKAKASPSPMILMVLAENEKPFEFQLSSSAKLLVRERDSRTSVRRKTIALKTHLIELDKQILWTLRDWNGVHPSVFLIPSASISQRALKLYGCLRLLDSNEQQLHLGVDNELAESTRAPTPTFTVYTSIQDPTVISYGDGESTCGRIDRQGSQLFVLDHRQHREPFVVTLKTSLLQSTNSGGGAGAAAAVSHSLAATSKLVINDTATTSQVPTPGELAPHTFVFVIKDQNEFTAPSGSGVHRQTGSLPQQWFCAMSAADESKQIVVNPPVPSSRNVSGLYYLYLFSLHGVYYEVVYTSTKSSHTDQESDEADTNLINQPTPRDLTDISGDTQLEDEESEQFHAAIESGLSGGTGLLRCLLKLRQRRKKLVQAKPLPEFIAGTKVDSMKALTAAVTLRSKFLKAREMARHTRVLEREKTFADGLVDLVAKHNASFKRSRPAPRVLNALNSQLTSSSSSPSVGTSAVALQDQVQLLASFFREMAVHVPTETEGEDVRSVDSELIDQFGELFGRDTRLLNVLDEEKWMPDEERLGGKQQRQDEPAHNDYVNTAQYIEELMLAVAEQERGLDGSCDGERQPPTASGSLQQLQASWTHAQARSEPTTRSERVQEAQTAQFEASRRQEWMASRYVADLAAQARLAAASSPERTAMSLNKASFDTERRQLPWSPVWEVVDASDDPETCSRPDGAAQDRPLSPKRPRERPQTAATAVRTAFLTGGKTCEGDGRRVGRDAETAAASASFAYVNRLRLERVRTAGSSRPERGPASHSAPLSRPTSSSPPQVVPTPLTPSRQSGCGGVSGYRVVSTPDVHTESKTSPEPAAAKVQGERSASETPPMETIKEPTATKRRRRRSLSKSAASMRKRVNELLEVSKAVKSQQRVDDSVVADELLQAASSDVRLPSRSKVPSTTRK